MCSANSGCVDYLEIPSMETKSQISAIAPTVTIGLPVYNGAHFLAEAIESLLDLNSRAAEILIIPGIV